MIGRLDGTVRIGVIATCTHGGSDIGLWGNEILSSGLFIMTKKAKHELSKENQIASGGSVSLGLFVVVRTIESTGMGSSDFRGERGLLLLLLPPVVLLLSVCSVLLVAVPLDDLRRIMARPSDPRRKVREATWSGGGFDTSRPRLETINTVCSVSGMRVLDLREEGSVMVTMVVVAIVEVQDGMFNPSQLVIEQVPALKVK